MATRTAPDAATVNVWGQLRFLPNGQPDTVAIQSFPTFLSKLEPADFITDLLERGEQELLDLHHEELLHELLDMMACKAAIKAGDPLTPPEIEALLARRHPRALPRCCWPRTPAPKPSTTTASSCWSVPAKSARISS